MRPILAMKNNRTLRQKGALQTEKAFLQHPFLSAVQSMRNMLSETEYTEHKKKTAG